jgi:O-succinylbenzoic acid--CoA ligase
MSSIPSWQSQQALTKGDCPALIFERKVWTFADLEAISTQIAIELAQQGITKGSCVAVLLTNHPSYVLLLHASIKLGAIAALINIRLSPQEIAWQLQDCQAQLLVYDRTTAPLAIELPAWRSLDIADLADPRDTTATVSSYPLLDDIDLEAVQAIIYTSGTTGLPKGAQLTYGNHWHSAVASAFNLGVNRSDRWLLCLPIYHVGGLAIIWRSSIYGTTVVLHQRFDAATVIKEIATGLVTTISLVPTMLTRILENAEFPNSLTYWQNLRGILLGGAAPNQALMERCLELQLPIMPTYGLTETASQVTTLLPQDLARKPGSSGQPLLCNRIRIVAIACDRSEVPVGEIGQILVRGTNVMKGYINQFQVDAIQEGWLHTGDLGYIDREGFLYVVSRRTDLIVSGGENIYPTEIEAILQRHPAIVEACAIGIEDREWGQVVTVVAIAREPITLEEIRAFCTAHHLARYKLPRILHLVEALPKTANGKLSRQQVRESLANSISNPNKISDSSKTLTSADAG